VFAIAFCVYALASLVHFVHNAEFLPQYPNLPSSWTRTGVYLAWLGIMAVGVAGWVLIARGFRVAGLLLVALYAILGLDSLAHYVVAPLSAHTLAMNATILLEVGTAAVLLSVIIACAAREVLQGRRR
jgi:hypothetical protein